jgi:hypothetical protein
MRELAMAAVGLAPLVKQGQNLGGLLRQQAMHRRPTRRLVGEPAAGPAGDPPVRPPLDQLELVTHPAQRPALFD